MKTYNFAAGPAMLPPIVIEKVAKELADFQGTGMSILEISHRSKEIEQLFVDTRQQIRTLLGVPDTYDILFLQGGASTQFAMVPMNLKKKGIADYVITGAWAKKGAQEASKYLVAREIASSEAAMYQYIPTDVQVDGTADYVYICENNTIYGTKTKTLPDTKGIPLVSDMSSCLFSEPVDVSKYGLIFASVQKNIAPAGLTIVIIKKELIRSDIEEFIPTMLRYDIHAKNESLYNTPNVFAVYVSSLVFQWLSDLGGLSVMKQINEQKANLIYDYLDNSKLFKGIANKADRSLMNVVFTTKNKDLDKKFQSYAEQQGLVSLGGHRSIGGLRASIYNAMPLEGVQALVQAMKEFEMKVMG